MKNTADYKNLLEVFKRASHSGYNTLVVHNRMVIGCYDTNVDSDNGMHYVLHIPDGYETLYDGHFVWDNKFFLAKNAEIKKSIEESRKAEGLPPKAVTGEVYYRETEDKMIVEVSLLLHEIIPPAEGEKKSRTPVFGKTLINIGFEMECPMFSETNHNPIADNMLDTFSKLQARSIGDVILIDGLENDAVGQVQELPRVFYYKVDIDGESIQVPLMKSFFRGITKFDRMMFTVNKTTLDGIYLYTMTYESKGLIDQSIAYVQNFKMKG